MDLLISKSTKSTAAEDLKNIRIGFLVSMNIRRTWSMAAAQRYKSLTTYMYEAIEEKMARDDAVDAAAVK